MALRIRAEEKRPRVGALPLVLADGQQRPQEIWPEFRLRHHAVERGRSAVEGGRVQLEGAQAAAKEFMVLEPEHRRQ